MCNEPELAIDFFYQSLFSEYAYNFSVCGPGNFVNSTDGSCNPCPLSTFSSYYNAKACEPCYGGSITHSTGAKNYWECGMKLQIQLSLDYFILFSSVIQNTCHSII